MAGRRNTRFLGLWWPTARRDVAIFTASAIGASLITVGYTHQWGAQQWGPLSAWVAGLLTVTAVWVALREAGRGRRNREVDHEVQRRRDGINAFSDLWGAVMQSGLGLQQLIFYVDELPLQFRPERPLSRTGRVAFRFQRPLPGEHQTIVNVPPAAEPSIADDYTRMYYSLTDRWVTAVEPHVFRSLALLEDTPLKDGVEELMKDFDRIVNKHLPKITESVLGGSRPDTDPIKAAWKQMAERRQAHLEMVREHFGLRLTEVETFTLRGGWWASPKPAGPPRTK
jgi:hypothetical protein